VTKQHSACRIFYYTNLAKLSEIIRVLALLSWRCQKYDLICHLCL